MHFVTFDNAVIDNIHKKTNNTKLQSSIAKSKKKKTFPKTKTQVIHEAHSKIGKKSDRERKNNTLEIQEQE